MFKKESFSKKAATFLMFAGPSFILFIFFVIIPFIYGLYLTMTDWDGIAKNVSFVGLQNFATLFGDKEFWRSIWITCKYTVLDVCCVNAVGFLLAYLLTSGIKGENFLRAGFFTPNLIGGIVLGFIWRFLFTSVFPAAPFLPSTNMLSGEVSALWSIVIVSTWRQSGYMMLIYIAGFLGVPEDCIEAARIDGAGPRDILLRVRLPLMVQSFTVCLFLTLSGAFKIYDLNLSLTEGGPFSATKMASMTIFTKAFEYHQYGYGQAEALVFFIIMLIIALIQLKVTSGKEVNA